MATLVKVVKLVVFAPSVRIGGMSVGSVAESVVSRGMSVGKMVASVTRSDSGAGCFLAVDSNRDRVLLVMFRGRITRVDSEGLSVRSFGGGGIRIMKAVARCRSSLRLVLSDKSDLHVVWLACVCLFGGGRAWCAVGL